MSFAVPADAYDRFMGRYSVPLSGLFADFAGISGGHRVLDVGCGPGALTAELVARAGPGAVSAVDPSPPFVAAACARNPGVDVQQASAEHLPFPDGPSTRPSPSSSSTSCRIRSRGSRRYGA
jgi:trans-aconitate methyltransferase